MLDKETMIDPTKKITKKISTWELETIIDRVNAQHQNDAYIIKTLQMLESGTSTRYTQETYVPYHHANENSNYVQQTQKEHKHYHFL